MANNCGQQRYLESGLGYSFVAPDNGLIGMCSTQQNIQYEGSQVTLVVKLLPYS